MHRTHLSLVAAIAGLLAVSACGDGSTEPPPEPPNRPPAATGAIPAQSVAVGQTAILDASNYFNDPDGDPLIFTAATSDAAVATARVSGSTVTLSGVGKGMATITVTATDPDGLSARQMFQVAAPNRPPVVVDSLPPLELNSGDTATFDLAGLFEDPDGDTLTFAAETSDSTVVAAQVNESTVTLSAVGKGMATITITATDPGGSPARLSFEVTVPNPGGSPARLSFEVTVPNRPPLVVDSIPSLRLNSGDTAIVNVAALFEDPDGDTLTFSAESSDAGIVTASVSDSVVIFRALSSGTAVIGVIATDPGGLSVTVEAVVAVTNEPPQAVGSIPRQVVKETQSVTVGLVRYFEDPEGGAL